MKTFTNSHFLPEHVDLVEDGRVVWLSGALLSELEQEVVDCIRRDTFAVAVKVWRQNGTP